MAITRPLAVVLGGVINGAVAPMNFPAGVLQGDVGVVFGGHPYSGGAAQGPVTAGWTQACLTGGTSGAANPWGGCWYKPMGSTPDASVTMTGGGASADANAYELWVLRGVDLANILDVPAQILLNSVDPPAITPVTPGAWVFSCGVVGQNDTSVSAPSGYTDFTRQSVNDTRPMTVAVARKELSVAATENPPAYTDLGTSPVLPVAMTVAFRPAGATPPPADTSKFFQFL